MERYKLIHRVRYGYWYNCMQEVLHRRIAFCTNLVQLVAGCAAVAAVAGQNSTIMALGGIAAAICAAISLLLSPVVKELHFRGMKCKFLELREREHKLTDEALNSAILRLQREGETGLQLLASPASNQARGEMGYCDPGDFLPISWAESLACKFAH